MCYIRDDDYACNIKTWFNLTSQVQCLGAAYLGHLCKVIWKPGLNCVAFRNQLWLLTDYLCMATFLRYRKEKIDNSMCLNHIRVKIFMLKCYLYYGMSRVGVSI